MAIAAVVRLPADLEHVALGHAERLERASGQPGDALSAFFLPSSRDLQPNRLFRYRRIRHRPSARLLISSLRGGTWECPRPLVK